MSFTSLATKVYKDPATVVWANSIKANDDLFATGIAQAWASLRFTTGVVTALVSHNISNVIDSGAGQFSFVFTTGFTSTNIIPVGTCKRESDEVAMLINPRDTDTGQVALGSKTVSDAYQDCQIFSVAFFGRLK